MSVEDKKLAKKISILDAAYNLFLGRGVNMTAIDDVVKRAGVAKGTFYLYFKDKYDLLDQIIIQKSEGIFRDIGRRLEERFENSDVPASEIVIAFTDSMLEQLAENRGLVTLIQKNTSAFYSLWFSGENSEIREYIKRTGREYISAEHVDGIVKKMYVLTAAILSVCCDSILYGKPYTVDEIKPQLHAMIQSVMESGSFYGKEVRENEKIS